MLPNKKSTTKHRIIQRHPAEGLISEKSKMAMKTFDTFTISRKKKSVTCAAAIEGRGGSRGAIAPFKTYESNFFHYDFVQFGKQYSRYEASLPSTVLSQQCCEVYFISPAVVNP